MPYSDPDSPSRSVQSSPNAPRRFLPLHILKTLSPSKQIIPTISDSDSESEDESVSLPTSYYTSPSRLEKRRHLTVPSPRMAMLSIDGPARRLRSSIPGYGQGTKKTIRVSAARLDRSESTSTHRNMLSTRGTEGAFQSIAMRGAIPVSVPGLPNPVLESVRTEFNFRRTEGRCVQPLFVPSSPQAEGGDSGRQVVGNDSPVHLLPHFQFDVECCCPGSRGPKCNIEGQELPLSFPTMTSPSRIARMIRRNVQLLQYRGSSQRF